MSLLQIYKQSNTYKVLKQDLEKGTLGHNYMLIVPDEKLANEYAKLFAMQLYCMENNSLCMDCVNCKKIMHDNMGDIRFYPKNSKLSVEESRQIVSDSMNMPYESTKKLFIISNFDKATPQSQNALLKVLEEPTQTNVFLITCSSEATVLRTIMSRAKKIVENPVESELLDEYLCGEYSCVDRNKIKDVVSISGGNVTFATDLISSSYYSELLKDAITVVAGTKTSKDVLKMSCILSKYKDKMDEMLNILMQVFLDIKIAKASGEISYRLKGYENVLNDYPKGSIAIISKKIVECKNRVKFNCTHVAVIDYLLFGILEAKFICK